MHVVRDRVCPNRNTTRLQVVDVGPQICRFIIITDDFDLNASGMCIHDTIADSVVRNGKDTDFDLFSRTSDQFINSGNTVGFGTEPRLGCRVTRFLTLVSEGRHHFLQPTQYGFCGWVRLLFSRHLERSVAYQIGLMGVDAGFGDRMLENGFFAPAHGEVFK